MRADRLKQMQMFWYKQFEKLEGSFNLYFLCEIAINLLLMEISYIVTAAPSL